MKEIKNNVYYCGIEHSERKLFDELIPLEIGTSYNSYLIKGSEKTFLVDTAYPPKCDEFFNNIEGQKIDYVISLHAEQDHSGCLPELIKKYPEIKIFTNAKCKEFIQSFLHVEEDRFILVQDGSEVSAGDKTLRFHFCPFVHWPDTMFLELVEDKMLFTTDFLGAHYTFEGAKALANKDHENKDFGNDMYSLDDSEIEFCAKKYYAEIMMPFRTFAQKYVKKIKEINPSMILPSHGAIYKNPSFILDLYEDWTSDKAKNKVLIPYVSMYESTKLLIERLKEKLVEAKIDVCVYDINACDIGEMVCDLVDANTIVLGASMVLAGPHPAAVSTAYLINALRPKAKNFAIVGSYGWGGNLTSTIEAIMSNLKSEKLTSVIIKGRPEEEDYKKVDALAQEIIERHNKEFN